MGNLFSKNLKFLREKKGISKNKLGELVGVNQTTIGRWESEEITPSIDNVEEVAKVLNVGLPDLLIKDLSFDNGDLIEIDDTIQIPVLGTIKAGIPKIRLYDLRHTYVALMMSEGKELYHISKRLGHSKYSTTVDQYGHLDTQIKSEIAQVSDKYLNF